MSRALFIGRSVIDLTCLVEEFPASDSKVKALENDIMPGGSALNAAVTFTHLGGRADLASALGEDGLYSGIMRADLRARGVTPIDICDDPDYLIPLSTVVSTRSSGDRMIINAAGPELAAVRWMPEMMQGGYDLIQLDQYEFPFVERHADAIGSSGRPVILDGGGWKDCSPFFLRLADIPIVSQEFLGEDPAELEAMCTDLGIARWAMTRGHKGVLWHDQGTTGEIPGVRVEAVDTLGAGDIFHGAFCYFFALHGRFIEALDEANRIAARSCTAAGTRSWLNG